MTRASSVWNYFLISIPLKIIKTVFVRLYLEHLQTDYNVVRSSHYTKFHLFRYLKEKYLFIKKSSHNINKLFNLIYIIFSDEFQKRIFTRKMQVSQIRARNGHFLLNSPNVQFSITKWEWMLWMYSQLC